MNCGDCVITSDYVKRLCFKWEHFSLISLIVNLVDTKEESIGNQ